MSDIEPSTRRCACCGQLLPEGILAGHCAHCLVRTTLTATDSEDDARFPTGRGEALPSRLGDYDLLEVIGRGGMGVVYRARQRRLQREVALKLLPGGEFAQPEFRRRFRQEAQAAARLRHPNIVAIHEVGEHEGVAFYSMELVAGMTLAERLTGGALHPRTAAEYLRTIADAVQHAHQAGILHRDLKPANVLIDRASNQPRVTDFGLAKRLDAPEPETLTPNLTLSGQALGSPAYMSPEQALGRSARIGPTGDVYSLGALLYHMLTGRPPFEGASVNDVLLQVRENDPIPPRRLNARVPVDLETICMRCLAKDPGRRYPTAHSLAEELARFLDGKPILERPVGTMERLWLWRRRRPMVAALAASVLLLLVIVATGAALAMLRIAAAHRAEHQERAKAESANADLRAANRQLARTVDLLELQQAEDHFRANDAAMGVAHLTAILRRNPSQSVAAARLVSALTHRDWVLPQAPPIRHEQGVRCSTFSPDGRQVLTVSKDGTARVSDSLTTRTLFLLPQPGEVASARASADGTRIVTASSDGTARIWNATNGLAVTPSLRHRDRVHWAEFSRDNHHVATASSDRTAAVWNASSGALTRQLAGHDAPVLRAHFSPDGQRLATVTESGAIRMWNRDTGEFLFELKGHQARVHELTFSPDGRRIVAACDGGAAWLWNPADGQTPPLALANSPWAPAWQAVFSPDGRQVLTTSEDAVARLWDAANGFPLGQLFLHEGGVVHGGFSPDGELIVTTSADISARIWSRRNGNPFGQPLRHHEPVRFADFSADGQRLVTASDDCTAQIWDITPRQARPPTLRHARDVTTVAFHPEVRFLLTASLDGTARIWNVADERALGEPMRHTAAVLSGDLSPDGRLWVAGCADGAAHLWEVATRRLAAGPIHQGGAIRAARFSPRGDRLVTVSETSARVWDARTGQPVTPALVHSGAVLMASFNPDGRQIVTTSEDQTARIWDAYTGQSLTAPLRHRDHVQWADFSPDGERIVTASTDNTACIWMVRTGRPATPLLQHARIVGMARFSPDGTRVVTVSQDRTARVWDAFTGQALTPPMPHFSAATHVSFSPDSRRILTGGWNGMVRVWDAETGQPLTEWLFAGGMINSLGFDSTSSRIATGANGGWAKVWEVPQPPTPMPAWFLEFAEAVAGTRLSARGNVELLARDALEAAGQHVQREVADDFYVRLGRWFLAVPTQRSASPY